MKWLIPFLSLLSLSNPAKILVYSPILGHSHTKYLAAIAETLVDADHDVTVLMPVINVKERDKHCLEKTEKRIFVEMSSEVVELMKKQMSKMNKTWIAEPTDPMEGIEMARNLAKIMSGACENLILQTELLAQLRAENFELGILEPFTKCGLALFNIIGLNNHISALSTTRMDHVSRAVGVPSATSYVPGMMSVYTDEMNLQQRMLNTFSIFMENYISSSISDSELKTVRKYHPDVPDWEEMVSNSIFVFPNTIPFLDFPSPTISKVIPIGGISVNSKQAANKLPEKWDEVLNERKKTVFISFGSVAKSKEMPFEFKKSLIELFASLPDVTFIWKYEDEKDTLVDHLPNVHLGSWLPQTDLLADERLSLFITHGGLGSTMELTTLGKASIMIPLFADQYRNANMLTRHGGALVIVKEDLVNYDVLKRAIERILNDKKFSENAEKLANILQNQPIDTRERLLKHVEFAAKFGQQPHTDPYGRKLSLAQYYLLDALLLIVLALSIVLFVFYNFICFVIFSLCGQRPKPKLE